jgi:3-oxoacyl-ACP reductase-like protein
MGILGNIFDKVFHRNKAEAAPAPSQAAPAAPAPAAANATPAPAPAAEPVDVGAVLEEMASMKADHGGNYKTSIVDLLKLLDLDSSLAARKELAGELGVQVAADGSAEQNIALHRAVMDSLAKNGGVVPDSLRQ